MGFFDFLRPPPQPHPTLGPFHYARGHWHGTIALPAAERLALHLPGPRTGPHPDTVRLAEEMARWWTRARPAVEEELVEHHTAAREAETGDVPGLSQPADVWLYVTLSSVEIAPHGRPNEAQVALRVSWDEEHTLGALLRDARLVELNGSILEPH